jgi:tetratricopeptide (TPR) repeat protein
MFIFLALVFAGSFVVYGVGTGQGGLGDIFGNLGVGGGGGPSITKSRERTQKNPNDAQAWRDLARALENDNRGEEAIAPLEQYTLLRPKDVDGLSELAGLYLAKADRWAGEYQRLSLVELVLGAPGFALDPGSPFGQALSTDEIYKVVSANLSQQKSSALAEYSAAASQAVGVFQKIAKLRPDDPQAQLQLADAAERARDYKTAIDAYRRFLKLAPDSPDTPTIKARIKELEKLLKSTSPAAG